uniref:Uncharacterized protein n=1 Tax=viral metagenome TaxID=1070528 RepID=A0A6C0BMJ0_9ZZZZ
MGEMRSIAEILKELNIMSRIGGYIIIDQIGMEVIVYTLNVILIDLALRIEG